MGQVLVSSQVKVLYFVLMITTLDGLEIGFGILGKPLQIPRKGYVYLIW
jgi:hypothetical protein